jgi:hypothetical protein
VTLIAVCRSGPDGRTRHEGTDNLVRPLLAAQHLIRRSVALPHDLRFVVSSGVGCRRGGPFDIRNLELVKARQPIKFIPTIRGVGSLIPGLPRSAALQARKQSRRCVSKAFHFILSARVTGLVAAEYGQHSSERKQVCPTEDGSNPTRNRVNVP